MQELDNRQMSPTARLCVFRMALRNLVGPRKSARSVCYSPRKWREIAIFKKRLRRPLPSRSTSPSDGHSGINICPINLLRTDHAVN